MAVPKRKTSPSRRNMRRSHHRLAAGAMSSAPIAASRSARITSAAPAAIIDGREVVKAEG